SFTKPSTPGTWKASMSPSIACVRMWFSVSWRIWTKLQLDGHSMNKADIQQLYRYNKWANGVVITSVTPLSTDEFTRQLGGSFPSVRDTLAHIMAAEWLWLRRWKGVSPRALFDASELPNLEPVKLKWSELETEQTAFADEV